MTLQELNSKVEEIRSNMTAIVDTCEAEVRRMTEDEQTSFNGYKDELDSTIEQLRQLEAEMARAEIEARRIDNDKNKSNSTIMEKKSLGALIQDAYINKRSVTAPLYEARALDTNEENGGKAVMTDIYELAAKVRQTSVLNEIGCTVLPNLKNNEAIVLYQGADAQWVSEGEDVEDRTGNLGKVVLSPKMVSAQVVFGNMLLAQSDIDKVVTDDIVAALAEAVDKAIFGDGEEGKAPEGLCHNVDTVDMSWANILDIEKNVEEKNANVKYFVINPAIKAKAKQTSVSGGRSDIRMIMDTDNTIDGVPVIVTNASKGIIAGDFAKDLVVGYWNGAGSQIVIDPFTLAHKNQTRAIVTLMVDAKLRGNQTVSAKKIA